MAWYCGLKQGLVMIGGMAIVSCTPLIGHPSSPEATPSPSSPVATLTPSSKPLPVADANGDYGRTDYQMWQVVDSDPGGLNCRWSTTMPPDWYSPSTQFPNRNFGQWQMVRQFSTGTTLTANLAPAGFAILYDEQQKPWLKVSIGEDEQICLVRANANYVQPIAK
ncbi:MAG TPA: hypothetical protein V6C65_33540 [Allocoleopsis sp.]